MREHRVHFDAGFILCHDPRTVLTHTDPNEVTCRRCLYLLGRYASCRPTLNDARNCSRDRKN